MIVHITMLIQFWKQYNIFTKLVNDKSKTYDA